MLIEATRHSAILSFYNLPAGTTPAALADWLWSRVGLALPETDVEIRQGADYTAATVRVPRAALADFLDRAVSGQLFEGRQICVRPKRPSRPRLNPNEGREGEH
jgi:hypothetical protein